MRRSEEYVANTLVLLDYYPLSSGADWSIEVLIVSMSLFPFWISSK
jgi:hypothetical protein